LDDHIQQPATEKNFSIFKQQDFLCRHLTTPAAAVLSPPPRPDISRKTQISYRGPENISPFPCIPPPILHMIPYKAKSPSCQQGSVYIFCMVQKFLNKYREMSTCMPASFDIILAAQPLLLEGGLYPCPLAIRNFATWHLPLHPFSAPKGQPIQGGDRSKTTLLILS